MRFTTSSPLLVSALLATLTLSASAQESHQPHQPTSQRAAEAPARPLNLSLPHLAPGQVRMGQREEVRQMQAQGGVTGGGEALQLQQQSRLAVQMRYGSGYEARHAGAGAAAAASSAAPAMGPGGGRGR